MEKKQQGTKEQMLGGRLEGRLGMVPGVQAVVGEGVERGGGIRRRERTGGSGREGREEESNGTGKATSSLSLGLVESPLGWVLQPLSESQRLVLGPFHAPVTENMEGDQNSRVIQGHLDMLKKCSSTRD